MNHLTFRSLPDSEKIRILLTHNKALLRQLGEMESEMLHWKAEAAKPPEAITNYKNKRIDELEDEVATLKKTINELKAQLTDHNNAKRRQQELLKGLMEERNITPIVISQKAHHTFFAKFLKHYDLTMNHFHSFLKWTYSGKNPGDWTYEGETTTPVFLKKDDI